MKDDMEWIVKLHNLIKKQSILAFIAIISSLFLWGGSAYYPEFFLLQYGWDILINSICTWLMMNTSQKYWIFFKTYCCCCRICYPKLNPLEPLETVNNNSEKIEMQ